MSLMEYRICVSILLLILSTWKIGANIKSTLHAGEIVEVIFNCAWNALLAFILVYVWTH